MSSIIAFVKCSTYMVYLKYAQNDVPERDCNACLGPQGASLIVEKLFNVLNVSALSIVFMLRMTKEKRKKEQNHFFIFSFFN